MTPQEYLEVLAYANKKKLRNHKIVNVNSVYDPEDNDIWSVAVSVKPNSVLLDGFVTHKRINSFVQSDCTVGKIKAFIDKL